MSWAKRVRHPSEMLKKGDEIEVIVLDISQDKKRISLGMKQLQENPWDSLAQEYAVDTITQGTVTRILERGAVVELRPDVEGFVPVGQMAKPDLRHPEDCYAVGDVLPLKVIKIDPKNKRIVLSVSAYLKGVSDEELNEFHERFPVREHPAQPEETAEAAEGGETPATAAEAEAGAEAKTGGETPATAAEAETGGETPATAAEAETGAEAPAAGAEAWTGGEAPDDRPAAGADAAPSDTPAEPSPAEEADTGATGAEDVPQEEKKEP
ncbi:MAG: S1 RNA-binding domain-containing protein [bacterium]